MSQVRGWLGCCARAVRPGFGPARNPLRRRSDRVQAFSALAAVLLVLAVLPIAVLGSLRTWHHFAAISDRELASHHLVSATVVGSDPDVVIARNHLAELSWTYPDRVNHTGHIAVTQATQAGDLIPLWVDQKGAMDQAPMTRLNVWLDTLGLGLGLTVLAAVIALGGYQVSRFWLNRRRTRDLDAEWRRFNESRSEGFRDTAG
jgi:hypothetical protein